MGDNRSATFDPEPFAEGRFRYAYKGTHTVHPTKNGQHCVVKKKKDAFTWKSTDWDATVEMYTLSKQLASAYNKKHNCTLSIQYVDVEKYIVSSISGNHSRGPKLNEYVVVEDFLPGNFTKWTNNYGYISQSSELLPAFMHWSWVESGGQRMIADLQGVRTDDKYLLTDPVIMSNSVSGCQYGCTDTGVEGMAMFFLKHTCNQFCNTLPKPTIQDVVTSRDAQLQISSLGTSTAYSHELKIPVYLKERMTSVFPSIATRHTGRW